MHSAKELGTRSARDLGGIFVVVPPLSMPPSPLVAPAFRTDAGASPVHTNATGGTRKPSYTDSYQRCLHDLKNPHCHRPMRRVVLGPLPSTIVSSDTLVEAARNRGINIDVFGVHESSPEAVPLASSSSEAPSARIARLMSQSKTQAIHTSLGTPRSRSKRYARTASGDTTQIHSPSIGVSEDPRSVWADIDEQDTTGRSSSQSTGATKADLAQENIATPVIDSSKWFGRKPRPPPLSLGSTAAPSLHSPPPERYPARDQSQLPRAQSLRKFSDSGWSGISSRSASPTPAPLNSQWLNPELQESLEQQIGENIGGSLWIGGTFEVGAHFWAQFENVSEFGSNRPRAASTGSGRPRASSSASGVPPMIEEDLEPREAKSAAAAERAPQSNRRIISPYVGQTRRLSPNEVESRMGWESVSERLNKADAIPRIRPIVRNPDLKPILKQTAIDTPTPAPVPVTAPAPDALPAQPPAIPQKSADRPPSVRSVAPPPRPPKSDARSSPEADHESLESLPADEEDHVVVSLESGDSDSALPQRAMTRTRTLFNAVAPSLRSRHVTFAPNSDTHTLDSLKTESAAGASTAGCDIASAIAARGQPVPVGSGYKDPAPAGAVLARDSTPQLPEQSGDWAQQIMQDETFMSKPVLKRDRMLVKVQTTSRTDLPANFDEFESRRFEVRSYVWAEYMVVLRPGRLELWSEATVRGRIFGDIDKLKLRYVFNLDPAVVSLSMYSSADRLFCITLPRRTTLSDNRRGRLNFWRSGSYIFIFNARMITLAADWLWILWRELGGKIPSHIFVHLPFISMRVRIPVPQFPSGDETKEYAPVSDELGVITTNTDEPYNSMLSASIIRHVLSLVVKLQNWEQMVRHAEQLGMSPRLAWRCGNTFNWVTADTAADGSARFWSVLVGEMLASHRHVSDLELMLNWHYPSEARKPDGKVLTEPPSVEGFVWRVRPVSGTVQRVYLTVHDSCVFMCRPTLAFAPDPFFGVTPELSASVRVPDRAEYIREHTAAYRRAEQNRCFRQIRHCEGFVDLCDVEVVRSVGTGQVMYTSASRANINMVRKALRRSYMAEHVDEFAASALGEDTDDSVEALVAHIAFPEDYCKPDFDQHDPAVDQAYVRSLRQFELILNSGRVVSFECLSPALARDWIVRLFQLSRYWRCRRRTDTWNIMRLTGASNTLKPDKKHHIDRRLVLAELWNWCQIEGCRSMSHSGMLFWRKGTASLYRQRYVVVADGRIILFKTVRSTRSQVSRQNEGILYKRVGTPISLRDAYVYQARVSDRPVDINSAAKHDGARRGPRINTGKALPRLYSHGLYSSDSQEDCTFIVHVRIGYDNLSARQNVFRLLHSQREAEQDLIPGLSDKAYGELVFCARTIVERDIWMRVIMFEIERLARRESDREQSVRNRGHV